MKEVKLPSTDGINNLNVYIWEAQEPKAILQISHGMTEHMKRYDDFAKYLVSNGVIVIGNDHLGHGKTAKKSDFGYFGSQRSQTVVDDLYEVTKYAKKEYGDTIPYIILGHSMGSFMARRYLMTYGKELNAAILMGTGSQPQVALSFGLFLADVIGVVKGQKYIPKSVEKLAFGNYTKKIENSDSKHDWLTRDKDIIAIYEADEFCTFSFTVDGYKTLFGVIKYIQKRDNIDKIPKSLPILFVSGSDDPVGNYGVGVKTAYEGFDRAGIKNVEMVIYDNCRHELLNEVEREDIYNDLLYWIQNHI